PAAAIPRTSDGKPNLSAPAPRMADGKPDLSGVWEPNGKYVQNLAADLKPDEVPFQPWAQALYDERKTGAHSKDNQAAHCLPQGVPRINFEAFTLWRQIFLDGREMAVDVTPSWLGYSVGKWEGDTLVVDTKGFNGKAWIDQLGKPSTEALHVIERFRRR